jgi:hypothetical protein
MKLGVLFTCQVFELQENEYITLYLPPPLPLKRSIHAGICTLSNCMYPPFNLMIFICQKEKVVLSVRL